MERFWHGAAFLGTAGIAGDGRHGFFPVAMTPEDVSVRDGRAFIAATPRLIVTSGNYLHCKLSNPANSGKNMLLTNRRFVNTGANILGYMAFSNPAATPAITGVIPNRLVGGPAATAIFQYEENTNAIFLGGTTGSVEAIPADGIVAERILLAIIPPGASLGFMVSGDGGPINGGNVTASFEFYEENIVSP